MVGISPVMSRGFGAPVNVQSRTPNVEESTVNTTYFPFTRKFPLRFLAAMVNFRLPETPRTENPPPMHPADEAARATSGIHRIKDATHAATATACLTIRPLIFPTSKGPHFMHG